MDLFTGPSLFQDNIVGSSYVAASYLKDIGFSGKVYVIGSTGVTEELDALGIEHIGMEVRRQKPYSLFSKTLSFGGGGGETF